MYRISLRRNPVLPLLAAGTGLCALLLLSACSKSETVADPVELSLFPVAHASTKADPELDGTSLGTDHTYVIRLSASTPQQPFYLTDQLFSYIDDGDHRWKASSAPGTHTPVYWPGGGERVDLLACALTQAACADLTLAWSAAPADGFTVSDWDTYACQYDVMYAACNNRTGGVVDLGFRHTLAVLAFTAECTDAGVFTLDGITVDGLEYGGSLTVDNSRSGITSGWTTTATGDKDVRKRDDASSTDLAFAVPAAAAQCAMHLLVPPQYVKDITIHYSLPGSDLSLDYTIRLPRTFWRAGYKSTYALRFTPTEVLADPSITDWDGLAVELEEDI